MSRLSFCELALLARKETLNLMIFALLYAHLHMTPSLHTRRRALTPYPHTYIHTVHHTTQDTQVHTYVCMCKRTNLLYITHEVFIHSTRTVYVTSNITKSDELCRNPVWILLMKSSCTNWYMSQCVNSVNWPHIACRKCLPCSQNIFILIRACQLLLCGHHSRCCTYVRTSYMRTVHGS